MLKNEKRADELQHYAEAFINFNNVNGLDIVFVTTEDVAYKIKEEFLPLCYGGRFTYKQIVKDTNIVRCTFTLDDCSELGLVTATIAEYLPKVMVTYYTPDAHHAVSVM